MAELTIINNENDKSHINKIKTEIYNKPLGKNQDYICSGEGYNYECEYIKWILVLDGHGTNKCIDFLKTYEWNDIVLREKEPLKYIRTQFVKFRQIGYDFSRSGSTFSLVEIYKNKIRCTNIGDSQTAVFKNNELVYINKKHNLQNELERNRVKYKLDQNNPSIKYEQHTIIEENQLYFFDIDYYAVFMNGLTLTVTQALGHNNYLDCIPEIQTIYYNNINDNNDNNDKIKIVIGSDGFWDMISLEKKRFNDIQDLLTLNSQELSEIVEKRWKQTWNCTHLGETHAVNFSNIDDISVGIITNY